jgi:hypothetical protein
MIPARFKRVSAVDDGVLAKRGRGGIKSLTKL